MMKRIGGFGFGVFSYLLGVTSLVAWILSMYGIVPFQYNLFNFSFDSTILNVLFAALLTSVFAIQHTIMARQKFKDRISKIIPMHMERPLFVLLTAIILHGNLLFWPQDNSVIWHIENTNIGYMLTGIASLGWAYLFIATFAINHFELFGLDQSYKYLRGQELVKVPFKERLMYKFDRHPIMTGAVLGMWFTPHMTMAHFTFSALFSLYILFGVAVEEKDLIKQWGEGYLSYKKRVKSIVPSVS